MPVLSSEVAPTSTQPEQLVEMLFKYPRDPRLNDYPWRHYERFRDQNHVFADLVALSPGRFQVTGPTNGPEVVDGMYVSGNFFDALGLRPEIGRLIGPQDNQIGSAGSAVAVINQLVLLAEPLQPRSYRVGRSLIVNDVPTTIVGVTRPEFFGLQLGMDPPL